jgi:hypothetical protein
MFTKLYAIVDQRISYFVTNSIVTPRILSKPLLKSLAILFYWI